MTVPAAVPEPGTVVHKTWEDLLAEQPNRAGRRAMLKRYGMLAGARAPGGGLRARARGR
jgi:hypothetical protein